MWWSAHYLPRLVDHKTLAQQGRDYLLPPFGKMGPAELLPFVVETALAKIKKSPRTVNGIRGLLKRVLRDAIANRLWEGGNPVDAVKARKIDRKHWPTLTEGEARALIASAAPPYRARWAIALYLGLRPGEVRALRRSDVDLTTERALLVARSNNRDATKTGRSRKVPICDELAHFLEEHLRTVRREHCALLFPNEAGAIYRKDERLTERLEVALRRAKIFRDGMVPSLRAYDLRHSFHALARKAGVNREVIRMVMGHLGDMTSGYGAPTLDEARSELGKLKLFGDPGGPPGEKTEPPDLAGSEGSKSERPCVRANPLSRHPDSNWGPTDYETKDPFQTPRQIAKDGSICVEPPGVDQRGDSAPSREIEPAGIPISIPPENAVCQDCKFWGVPFKPAVLSIQLRPLCRQCADTKLKEWKSKGVRP